jgi:hypothetical protein
MFITITRSWHIELQDSANFRAFKILDRSGKSPDEIAAALDGFATLTPDGTAAWVDVAAVPKLLPVAPTAEWQTPFNAMVAKASKSGWVDEAKGAVRTHIERAEVA